jgi:hypothetical protein
LFDGVLVPASFRSITICLAAVGVAACARGASEVDDIVDAGDDGTAVDAEPDAPDCVPTGVETCNGVDDDCVGGVDDPFGVGDPCDGDDADRCDDDVIACNAAGDGTDCVDQGGALVEVCNGADDDCDPSTADGSADAVGVGCDGGDGDVCVEGTTACTGGMLQCSDATGTTADLCNSLDDDCDPASADGSEDPMVGPTCDGPDGDLCTEGTRACASGGVICTDTSSTTVDLCNGLDDDCDPASSDGSEDPAIGVVCDGADGDLCVEGTRVCSGGGPVCNDTTGTTTDVCNGADDDCDPASADGSEDPAIGVACDGPDGDACTEGTRLCSSGSPVCSDNTGTSVEACNGADDDCDGTVDDGFVRDSNPTCAAGTVVLGSVSGDASTQTLNASSFDERWYRLTIREDSVAPSAYLSATVALDVAPSADFDLYVYCLNCGGALAGQSEQPAGVDDVVNLRKNDSGATDTFDVLIEVRHYETTVCAPWTLTVTSDTAVATPTCN